jgi:UDP-N-acetylmuramyl pentapeptide phosphotransferase/UDP-N-acetylglucosamine-1-phosphate transferase
MYQTLTFLHSLTRWFVLLSLLYAIYRAYIGYSLNKEYSKTDNRIRHWTATTAHIQLIIGILFYIKSPVISYFWNNVKEGVDQPDIIFFGLYHIIAMLTAIVLITIGSAKAKRKIKAKEKFRIQLVWFLIALVVIFIAIPWPFSPFTTRPYLR